MPKLKKALVVSLAVVAVLASGAAAYTLVPWKSSDGTTTVYATQLAAPNQSGPLRIDAVPPAGATNVPLSGTLSFATYAGTIDTLTVTDPSGNPVPGDLVDGNKTWIAVANLQPSTTYHVNALVKPNDGARVQKSWTFTTVAPSDYLDEAITPGDNEVRGVGQPIIVKFSAPVANKEAVQQRLKVTTTPAVLGAWRWMSDTEVHWRPANLWPAHTAVALDADIQGVDAGNGVYGNVHRTVHFMIGDSHVSVANAQTHMMAVYQNGQLIQNYPISLGRPKYPTMSGRHIVLDKAYHVVMDSSTNGIPVNSPDGYREDVFWNTHISEGGEYVHAAPWSVGSQGNTNVSHGCVNLSVANAEWFYNWSMPGDIVDVVNTGRPPENDPGVVDWILPFSQWASGGAIPVASSSNSAY
ncbi:MAG TPA: Ig-like domain-containing protein [Acidimicrobiia bacterium]|jgi:lipoprotein-anchoring transpeptidase ErfK/SrfK